MGPQLHPAARRLRRRGDQGGAARRRATCPAARSLDQAGLDNPIFLSINRNKRSRSRSTPASEEGKDVIRRLVRDADVVVSNFRGRRDGADRLRLRGAVEPSTRGSIWASGTGFGDTGPYSHKGGQDVIAQAYSGVMWRRESDEIPLSVYPTTLCDYTTGMHLMQGILLALMARERTGEGQKVDVTMYDSMLHMQMQEACMQLNRGYEINWAAMPLSGVFPTTDGAVCMVGAFKQQPAAGHLRGARARGGPLPAAGVRDHGGPGRAPARAAGDLPGPVRAELDRALGQGAGGRRHPLRPGAHAGRGAGGRADDGQPDGRGDGAPDRRHGAGAGGPHPPVVDAGRRPARAAALGEHNAEVLREHGFTDDEVAALAGSGVLR